jgi:oligosaccharide repeat unit polymerase
MVSGFALLVLDKTITSVELSVSLYLLIALVTALFAIYQRRSVIDNPIYLVFYSYICFLGVGPLVAQMIESKSLAVGVLTHVDSWPLLLSWLGLASMVLGYLWGNYPRHRSNYPELVQAKTDHRTRRFMFFGGVGLTALGIAGAIVYLSKVGGLNYLLATPYGERENPSVYAGLFSMLRPGLFLLMAWTAGMKKIPLWITGMLLSYLAFDLMWFGPLTGSRRQVITLVVTLVLINRYCGTDGRSTASVFSLQRWLLATGLLVALVWGGLRTHSAEEIMSMRPSELNVATETKSATVEALYYPFLSFVRIVELVPNFIPYQTTRTLYESLTVVIPRDLWKTKPDSIGDWLARSLYGSNIGTNTVPTWPGELYMDFGVSGIIVGMIGMGFACARISRWTSLRRSAHISAGRRLLAAIFFPFFFEWIWGGSNTAVWYVLFNVLPVCIVLQMARVHRHQPISALARQY